MSDLQSIPTDGLDDETLAREAITSETAFALVYERYLPKIFGFVTRRIADRAQAEDIVSNIFVRVVEHIADFDPKKSSFKTWAYTIATRMMIDHFRSHSGRETKDIEYAERLASSEGTPHHNAVLNEEKEKVIGLIQQLPERHQKVLMLKYFSDFSVDELAESLGCTNNNASVMLHRALSAFELAYEREKVTDPSV